MKRWLIAIIIIIILVVIGIVAYFLIAGGVAQKEPEVKKDIKVGAIINLTGPASS